MPAFAHLQSNQELTGRTSPGRGYYNVSLFKIPEHKFRTHKRNMSLTLEMAHNFSMRDAQDVQSDSSDEV